jgi:hypothetical protein
MVVRTRCRAAPARRAAAAPAGDCRVFWLERSLDRARPDRSRAPSRASIGVDVGTLAARTVADEGTDRHYGEEGRSAASGAAGDVSIESAGHDQSRPPRGRGPSARYGAVEPHSRSRAGVFADYLPGKPSQVSGACRSRSFGAVVATGGRGSARRRHQRIIASDWSPSKTLVRRTCSGDIA